MSPINLPHLKFLPLRQRTSMVDIPETLTSIQRSIDDDAESWECKGATRKPNCSPPLSVVLLAHPVLIYNSNQSTASAPTHTLGGGNRENSQLRVCAFSRFGHWTGPPSPYQLPVAQLSSNFPVSCITSLFRLQHPHRSNQIHNGEWSLLPGFHCPAITGLNKLWIPLICGIQWKINK